MIVGRGDIRELIVRISAWRVCSVLVFGLLISAAATTSALADNGRDFTARFSVSPIGALGQGTSRVHLVLNLQNVSGSPIRNAVIELDGSRPAPTAQSFRRTVSLADRAQIIVSGDFSVATADLQQWSLGRGQTPRIALLTSDSTGQQHRHTVEVIGWMHGARP